MLKYKSYLKENARELRKEMTDSERVLWSRLRRKQLMNVQLYRQKPIGPYIVDFFAPKVKLIIEIDGSQHLEAEHLVKDQRRDTFLANKGFKILRFNSRQVLKDTTAVIQFIYREIEARLNE